MTKIATKKTKNQTVGRRKCASARVRLVKGTGKIVVNGKPLAEYFPHFIMVESVMSPLKVLAKEKEYDISVKVVGGGKKGQSDAVRHGIARALVLWNEEFRKALKTQGMLTRDARVKERKKFGLKSARRAPQWSKR